MNLYIKKLNFRNLWFASLIILFAITHFTNDRLFLFAENLINIIGLKDLLLDNHHDVIVSSLFNPIRSFLFTISIIFFSFPIFRDIINWIKNHRDFHKKILTRKIILNALLVTFVMSILIIPNRIKSMGVGYEIMSFNPFETESGWYNTRLLMPFLANFVFLYGKFFYFIFFVLLIFVLIIITTYWLLHQDLGINTFQLISICTSSFIMYQFQLPGYPDVLLHILLLASIAFQFSNNSKIALLVLSLLTHESSLFITSILSIFILDKKSLVKFYGIFVIYLLFWVSGYGFDLSAALASHRYDNINSLQWVLQNPLREVLGIFFSYKLLWLFIIFSFLYLIKVNQKKKALLISLLVLSSIFMTLLAVDTSRLVGWSFIGLLLSVQTIHRMTLKGWRKKILNSIYIVNLMIPSIHYSLNVEPKWSKGLYVLYKVLAEHMIRAY